MEKELSEIIRNLTLSIAATGALIAGVVGIYFSYRRMKTETRNTELSRLNLEETEKQVQIAEARHITEAFTKAVDQLGHDSIEVRLGAIYSLERVAADSRRDFWPIIETLTAYIRNNAGIEYFSDSSESKKAEKRIDIQAILTVLGRRDVANDFEGQSLDLSAANLEGYSFQGNFDAANFHGSNLENCYFVGSFKKANFNLSRLLNAGMEKAVLKDAMFAGAYITDVKFPDDVDQIQIAGANYEGIPKLKSASDNLKKLGIFDPELMEKIKKDKAHKDLITKCSFCGISKAYAEHMVEGKGTFICNECLREGNSLVTLKKT